MKNKLKANLQESTLWLGPDWEVTPGSPLIYVYERWAPYYANTKIALEIRESKTKHRDQGHILIGPALHVKP